eukprot:c7426_g1_i1.p1 GENE.c7426_g1_i1~~c7426_g1_i1.p1  ORF type:complete len:365 (-),score=67.18 c7426_g1_i1:46-990(-)
MEANSTRCRQRCLQSMPQQGVAPQIQVQAQQQQTRAPQPQTSQPSQGSADQPNPPPNLPQVDAVLASPQYRAISGKFAQLWAHVRPLREFVNISRISVPSSMEQLQQRVSANLKLFQGNYLLILLILLTYFILTSPVLLMGAILIFAVYYFTDTSSVQSVQTLSSRLPPYQRLILLIVAVILAVYFVTSSITTFVYAVAIAAVIVFAHASFFACPRVVLREEVPVPAHTATPVVPQPVVFRNAPLRPQPHRHSSTAPVQTLNCPICLSSTAQSAVIIPCGHTSCIGCATSIQSATGQCPICRVRIQAINPLYPC